MCKWLLLSLLAAALFCVSAACFGQEPPSGSEIPRPRTTQIRNATPLIVPSSPQTTTFGAAQSSPVGGADQKPALAKQTVQERIQGVESSTQWDEKTKAECAKTAGMTWDAKAKACIAKK